MNRRIAVFVGLGMMGVSLSLLAMMLWLQTRVPYVSDLYNQVYQNSRPGKPEPTDEFLLVFPAFCCTLSGLASLGMVRSIRHGDQNTARKLIFSLGIFAVFAIGTVIRFHAVRQFYGV